MVALFTFELPKYLGAAIGNQAACTEDTPLTYCFVVKTYTENIKNDGDHALVIFPAEIYQY